MKVEGPERQQSGEDSARIVRFLIAKAALFILLPAALAALAVYMLL